jgi:hypothetical protein
MGGHHRFHARRLFSPQMNDSFDGFHFHARAREFQPARTKARHEPADHRTQPLRHFSQRQATGSAQCVLQKAAHRASAPASAAWLAEGDFVA